MALFDRQLVRGERGRQGGALGVAFGIQVVHILKIRAVASHTHVQAVADFNGVDGAGVDVAKLGDLLLQAFMRFVRIRRRAVTGSEVEAGQPILAGFLAARDAVEAVLHIRGELVVHVLREVRFQEFDHGERQPRWNQRPAALIHVAAVDDGGNNARVG